MSDRGGTRDRPPNDITSMPTAADFLFLAVVLDAWSRRIVGWAFSHDLKTQLVLDALGMAIASRRPKDVIHHSDKGSQHTSWAFGHRCRAAGIRPSTGTAGDALDNAPLGRFALQIACRAMRVREPLRHARVQADRPPPLRHQGRGPDRRVPLYRGLLEPVAAPLVHRLHITRRARSRPPIAPCPDRHTHTRKLPVKPGQLQRRRSSPRCVSWNGSPSST